MTESVLAGLEAPSDIKDAGDFLGGYTPFESGLYDMTVKLAYFSVSKGGAKCLNVTFVDPTGKELKQQFWVTSGTAKGGKSYYTNPKTIEKHFLPGFTLAKHLSLLTAGKELHKLTLEDRTIKLYSAEAQAEVNTPVPMALEMLGKTVTAGIIKRVVNKTKDSGTVNTAGTKIYIPIAETRIENEVVKLFRAKDKMTVTEILAKETVGSFVIKWGDKNTGITEDKTTIRSGGIEGAPSAATPSGADVSSLFA